MKKSFIFLGLAGVLGVVACSSNTSSSLPNSSDSLISSSDLNSSSSSLPISSSSSSEPVEEKAPFSTLREGLIYINEETNFSADVYLNELYGFSIYSGERFYGYDNPNDLNVFNLYVQDGMGVFTINVNDSSLVSSEYILDEDGENVEEIYENTAAKTFYSIFDNVIGNIGEVQDTYSIKDKPTRLAIMDALQIDRATYVYLNKVEAKFNNNALTIDLIFVDGVVTYDYTILFKNYASTVCARYDRFIQNGGAAFEPSEDLLKMRELINTDDFVRLTYDIDIEGYNSLMECFHPHYWYQRSLIEGGDKFGYISLNKRANGTNPEDPSYNPDLKGIYMFSTSGGKVSISPNVLWENTDITLYMHYPKYAKLFSKLQFFKEGLVSGFENNYSVHTSAYVTKNREIMIDFAKNNSLDRAYDLNKCIPFALGIELNLKSLDKYCTITFHYCFSYQGQKIDYQIPFTNFGEAGVDWLDAIFEKYNEPSNYSKIN